MASNDYKEGGLICLPLFFGVKKMVVEFWYLFYALFGLLAGTVVTITFGG